MTKPGPPPKPRELKLISGTLRKDRDAGAPLPYRAGAPDRPDHLGPVAAAEWDRVTRELAAIPGLLRKVDRAALAAYCTAWATYVHAELALAELGSLVVDGGKMPHVHPLVAVRRDAIRQLRELGALFGFSPSDRSRVTAPGGPKGGGKLSKYLPPDYSG